MAAIYATDQFELTKGMKIALIVSVLFHISVVVLGTVGWPYISKPPRLPQQPIAIEIVDVAEMTTTDKKPTRNRLRPVQDKPKEAPKNENKMQAPPKVEAKEPPKIKPLDKPEVKKDTVKPEPKVPPPPSEKLEKPKPPEKKVEKKEEATTQEELFESLLRNEAEPEEFSETDGTEPVAQEMSPLAKFSQKLSASEMDAIQAALNSQFSTCWNLMAGARFAEDIVVPLFVMVNPDRTIRSITPKETWRYNQDSFYKAATDAAKRAFSHPNCQVLDLPPDKHHLWKDGIIFNFDPSRML